MYKWKDPRTASFQFWVTFVDTNFFLIYRSTFKVWFQHCLVREVKYFLAWANSRILDTT